MTRVPYFTTDMLSWGGCALWLWLCNTPLALLSSPSACVRIGMPIVSMQKTRVPDTRSHPYTAKCLVVSFVAHASPYFTTFVLRVVPSLRSARSPPQ